MIDVIGDGCVLLASGLGVAGWVAILSACFAGICAIATLWPEWVKRKLGRTPRLGFGACEDPTEGGVCHLKVVNDNPGFHARNVRVVCTKIQSQEFSSHWEDKNIRGEFPLDWLYDRPDRIDTLCRQGSIVLGATDRVTTVTSDNGTMYSFCFCFRISEKVASVPDVMDVTRIRIHLVIEADHVLPSQEAVFEIGHVKGENGTPSLTITRIAKPTTEVQKP